MTENETQAAPQAVKLGAVQRINSVSETQQNNAAQEDKTAVENSAEGNQSSADATQSQKQEISNDELVELLKGRGISVENFEQLKQKTTVTSEQPTDEEIADKNEAIEKRALDKFLAGGGKVENWVAIKNVANADIKELSRQETLNEYLGMGFTNEEAEDLIKERYYQAKLDDMVFDEDGDESKEDFDARKAKLQKRADAFSAKLESRASYPQNQAKELLNKFKQEVLDDDLQAQKEAQFAANVDKHLSQLPRRLNIPLGKLNDNDLGSVEIDVDESDISEIALIFKDPEARKQTFFNEDYTLNFAKLSEVLLRNKAVEKVARNSYQKGTTDTTAEIKKVFPSNPYALGGLGSPQANKTGKGEVHSAGKVQRV